MGKKGIVTGQKIDPAKVKLAKKMRNEMTYEEAVVWEHLRANRLNGLHFRRQQIIRGYIADFYCHQAGLVVEIDGEVHKNQKEYDQERDLVFSEIGLRILRISNNEVNDNLLAKLKQISDTCKNKESND